MIDKQKYLSISLKYICINERVNYVTGNNKNKRNTPWGYP